jgi:hypothetical protein
MYHRAWNVKRYSEFHIYRLSNGCNLPQSNSVSIIRIITIMFPLTFWEPVTREILRHFNHLSPPEECFL